MSDNTDFTVHFLCSCRAVARERFFNRVVKTNLFQLGVWGRCKAPAGSRRQAILIDIFKNLMHQSPAFMWNCYKPKHINYNLRNTNTLCIPHSKTTRYGLQTLTAYGAKLWNSLPNNIKSCTDLNHFKSAIETWQEPRCKCRMCRP